MGIWTRPRGPTHDSIIDQHPSPGHSSPRHPSDGDGIKGINASLLNKYQRASNKDKLRVITCIMAMQFKCHRITVKRMTMSVKYSRPHHIGMLMVSRHCCLICLTNGNEHQKREVSSHGHNNLIRPSPDNWEQYYTSKGLRPTHRERATTHQSFFVWVSSNGTEQSWQDKIISILSARQ